MNYNPVSIILGIIVLLALSYGVILAITISYLKFVLKKTEEYKEPKFYLSTLVVSVAWLLAVFLSIWAAGSTGTWIFGIVSAAILLVAFYLLSRMLFGIKGWQGIAYTFVLALILNPIWFVFLGGLK